MRTILLCAVGALTLAACQQPATPEDTPAPAAAEAEVAAPAASSGPTSDAASTSGPASASSATGRSSAGNASTDTAAPSTDDMMRGPSQATRDSAKEKAEETNLHPRTP